MRAHMQSGNKNNRCLALQFIILLGLVSLFGDITYEGARSVTGPFLSTLGAGAAVVGLVAGLGEFLGYVLRLISGYMADRTGRYWVFVFIGYGLILSIPLLALSDYWEVAAVLIVLERLGKAIRTPARDTILSYSTKEVGRGWGFGIHEALDQIGAFIGPLIFSAVFFLRGGYRTGFTILWLPALLTLVILAMARQKLPSPEVIERPSKTSPPGEGGKLPKSFWLYTLFAFLSVAGFANFQVISYHFKFRSVVPDVQIPLFYAMAMGVDALVALAIGKTYDKIGLFSLIALPLLSVPIPFLGFSGSYGLAVAGVVFWGAVMGIQETIMRAAIADLTPMERRGFAYGVFNTAYGASWFLGSLLIGILYEISIGYVILFAVAMQVLAVPALFLLGRSLSAGRR
ncbi:MAG: MFS transporter [Syntrophobacterales bacterium]|nr:MAG: MFS transporter [Syntrophobacterales bacterium]